MSERETPVKTLTLEEMAIETLLWRKPDAEPSKEYLECSEALLLIAKRIEAVERKRQNDSSGENSKE